MKSSFTGSVSIVIHGETFPIVGAGISEQLSARILEERSIACQDLQTITPRAHVKYDDPNVPPYDIKVGVSEIHIRREGSQLIFEAVGYSASPNQENGEYDSDKKPLKLAVSRLRVSELMHIANYYIVHKGNDPDLVSDLMAAGNLNNVSKSQRQTASFHNDMATAVIERLNQQDVSFSFLAQQALCYLTTALLMHVMPARMYESQEFMSENVQRYFSDCDGLPKAHNAASQLENYKP